ncbi:MAG: PfkB family carbohydrate kinase, partial [Actinomycetota bacterium]|nr:PfkB family carbohydrate kinase [Actinomycetota bacterium]
MSARRMAVVGHVEWVEFVRVSRVPLAGEIAHGTDHWEEPAGGGGVAAVRLARLAGTSLLFTTLGHDQPGFRAREALERLGVSVHAVHRGVQRRAVTLVDDRGERTITTIGDRLAPSGDDPLPWEELSEADGVYV